MDNERFLGDLNWCILVPLRGFLHFLSLIYCLTRLFHSVEKCHVRESSIRCLRTRQIIIPKLELSNLLDIINLHLFTEYRK